MIAAMKKYAFLIFHKEYDDFLLRLRELGVVHIQQRNKLEDVEVLQELVAQRKELAELKLKLAQFIDEASESMLSDCASVATFEEGEALSKEINQALEDFKDLDKTIEHKAQEIKAQEVWGDFSIESLQQLKEAGYELAFYSCASSVYTEDYEQKYELVHIGKILTTEFFVRLEQEGSEALPEAERLEQPRKSLVELKQEQETLEQERLEQEKSLRQLALSSMSKLEAYDKILLNEYSLGATRLQALPEADDKLMYLEGWTPAYLAEHFETELAKDGHYFQNLEITKEDNVPVLLKNNFFTKAFEPVTKMFSLPNYGEIDQTVFLAPFFMLFFGLCLGDAGYGLLVLLGGSYLRIKSKEGDDTTMYKLMQWLGGAAFVVGMFTGSLFGYTMPYAKPADYFLNQDNLMMLSIVLGLIQIFFGKFIAAYKTKVQQGVKYALAPFAWIIFLLTIGAMLVLPNMTISLPSYVSYIMYGLVGISASVILFYNNPDKNPVFNVGSALWETYNVASGLLGDTLSYIRLFAIGLTGAILGGVFNQLAIEQTEGLPFVVRFLLMAVILLVGHGLNFAIAMIGAFVHPVRLTFVEFYKNSSFEGGGKAYTPFDKK